MYNYKLKMSLAKKMSLENYWSRYREFHHLNTICTRTESLGFEISYQAKKFSNECNLHSFTRMTAAIRLLILPTKRLIWTWVRRCHSWCSVCSKSFQDWTGGVVSFTRWPIMSQMCSVGFKSGLLLGHGSVVIDSSRK
jgi:hypothetical protein